MELSAWGRHCLARRSSTYSYASPLAIASGSPGQASRTILQSRRASARSPRSSTRTAEVAQGEVAVDALVDATELVGTLESQDPPPAGFGLGRLARLAMQDRLAEMQLVVVVGVDPQALGTRAESRWKKAPDQSWRSTAIAPRL